MKQLAVNVGVLLVVVGLFFFVGFAIYASFYRYGNPKLTETELQIWAIMNWWRWLLPLGVFGGGCGLIYWSKK
jgi:hypothetical protein